MVRLKSLATTGIFRLFPSSLPSLNVDNLFLQHRDRISGSTQCLITQSKVSSISIICLAPHHQSYYHWVEPSPDKRIVLHYLADSRSQRILWLLVRTSSALRIFSRSPSPGRTRRPLRTQTLQARPRHARPARTQGHPPARCSTGTNRWRHNISRERSHCRSVSLLPPAAYIA